MGVAPGEDLSNKDFNEKLKVLNMELETLNNETRELEKNIAKNVSRILGV